MSKEMVDHPEHYTDYSIEIVDKVLDGIEGKDAFYLGNILKYVIRAGKKNDDDLDKANNYAHRLCTGKWRWEEKETYPYVFPDATGMTSSGFSQVKKIKEECDEVMELAEKITHYVEASDYVEKAHALDLIREMIIEVLDVIHACETFLRIWDFHEDELFYHDIAGLRDEVIEKNRKRGYYGEVAEG